MCWQSATLFSAYKRRWWDTDPHQNDLRSPEPRPSRGGCGIGMQFAAVIISADDEETQIFSHFEILSELLWSTHRVWREECEWDQEAAFWKITT